MTRLSSVRPRQWVRALGRAGFEKHHQKGSFLYLWHPERRRMTSVPMHLGDVPRGTLRAILRQVELSVDELVDLLQERSFRTPEKLPNTLPPALPQSQRLPKDWKELHLKWSYFVWKPGLDSLPIGHLQNGKRWRIGSGCSCFERSGLPGARTSTSWRPILRSPTGIRTIIASSSEPLSIANS